MTRRGLAFLGCGFATRLHSRTLKRFPRVERYYASRDAERAREYATRYSGAGALASYEAAIDHTDVDVVLIGTPPNTHLPLARAALAAGKHVIVEKPPFLRSADFDQVEELVEATGRRLFVAENYFYKPLLREIRSVLKAGTIGDVKVITINALKQQKTGDWRDRTEDAGPGALFEGGIHWVSFLANLGLEVADAHGYRAGKREGPDRTMVAVFEYAGGAVGTLCYSWEIGSPLKGLRLSAVYGSEGAITFESNGLFLAVRGRRRRLTTPHPRDLLGYSAMFEDFFRALDSGGSPEYDLSLARRDLELVERIYATAGKSRHPSVDS
ncbi:MAG TPA: Gfo/Idh/MocA family oxidoreductase [Longimicrobiaceae bacterium]|nr:Gfo/Idh/MocA family oxidoreductase [Longimicrobiaceae bacterium]